jgi:transposase
MEKVIDQRMNMKEVSRFSVIKEVIDGYLLVKDASIILSISQRWVKELKKRVIRDGPSGLIHKNKGRTPINKISKEEKIKIVNLYKLKYNGFNISHYTEMLNDNEGINISRESVRKILKSSNLIIDKYKYRHGSFRERMPKEGMLIQMDTSFHDWFSNNERYPLIAAIDDASNRVLYASFNKKDTSINNMKAVKEIIEKYGIPVAFYVDRASHFFTTRHGGMHVKINEELEDTQIQRAFKEIGINLIGAKSPQAKDRIERLFETYQDRLKNELKLNDIDSIEKGNKFLNDIFIPKYNKKFIKKPEISKSAFRKLDKGINLNSIFSIKENRKVRNDNTVSYKGRVFQIYPDEYRISYVKAVVEIQEWIDETIHILYKDRGLKIKEIKKEYVYLTTEDELKILRKKGGLNRSVTYFKD